MDRLLQISAQDLHPARDLPGHHLARHGLHFRRRDRPAGVGTFHHPRRRMGHPARSRTQVRRSLHGRHASSSRKARSPTCSPSVLGPEYRRAALGAAAMAGCAISTAGSQQFNPRTRARRNVAHHYDLDGRLYSLFLDADRQYSCAYFETPDAVARRRAARQEAASRRQAAAASPDQRVLDIGCGWGGLGALSRRNRRRRRHRRHAVARSSTPSPTSARPRSGLAERARFQLQDYRDVAGPFDRIVSVGMFEHVGVSHYDTFFRKMRAAARRRRRDAAALDRPLGGPERHQSVDREIHLPRRLYPGAVGGAAGDRARRPAGHRHRDPAPALCRDAEGLARALPRPPRGGRAHLRRALRADVGVLSGRRRKCRSASRT